MITESWVIPECGDNGRPLLKRIHVHQATARANKRDGTNHPACIVQARGGPYRCHSVAIDGPSQMIQGEIACGATVWIKTYAEVRTVVLDGPNDLCTTTDDHATILASD